MNACNVLAPDEGITESNARIFVVIFRTKLREADEDGRTEDTAIIAFCGVDNFRYGFYFTAFMTMFFALHLEESALKFENSFKSRGF